jgi:large subunit ribosomal protein L2
MFKFYNVISSSAGRNNTGSITVRHRGSGIFPNKVFNYFNVITKFSGFIKFKKFEDSSLFVKMDSSGFYNFMMLKNANSTYSPGQLYTFKAGTNVCAIESYPGSGPKYVRSIHSRAVVLKTFGTRILVRIPSGELRKFKSLCFAFPSLNRAFVKISKSAIKAGYNRNLGFRPHVRGCAINPVDHPHGGRTGESRPSVSPWAMLTKGYRTRFKETNKRIIVISVQQLKDRKKIHK